MKTPGCHVLFVGIFCPKDLLTLIIDWVALAKLGDNALGSVCLSVHASNDTRVSPLYSEFPGPEAELQPTENDHKQRILD